MQRLPAFLSESTAERGDSPRGESLLAEFVVNGPVGAGDSDVAPLADERPRGGLSPLARGATLAGFCGIVALLAFLWRGDSLVGWAARSDRGALVRLLVRLQPKWANARDGAGWPVLVLCATNGDEESVRALLEAGADTEAVRGDAAPALYAAVARGHFGTVKLLLDHGADPDAFGGQAWNVAAARGRLDFVQLLDAARARRAASDPPAESDSETAAR